MATLVLVHSPFVGPGSLRPLAARLTADGIATDVPDLRAAVTEPPVLDRLAAAFAAALSTVDDPLVLVGHSGAGPLLPAFAATQPHVEALLFLDAELPTPGRSWYESAPAEIAAQLLANADGPRLAPWHRWFDAAAMAELVPDERLRADLAAEEPAVATAFLTERRAELDWPGPAGYLQLSDGYADAASAAERRGWPVRQLHADHLAAATAPDRVADALRSLLDALR
jgi:hypothetical protein